MESHNLVLRKEDKRSNPLFEKNESNWIFEEKKKNFFPFLFLFLYRIEGEGKSRDNKQ